MARVVSTVRSGPSRKACFLRFINRTSRKVDVIWIDYSGSPRNYGTLDSNRHFDIHTFEGHPWISEDFVTRHRMLLNNVEVFYPTIPIEQLQPRQESRQYMPLLSDNELIRNDERIQKREYVYITLPVFSLLELSADSVAKHIHSEEDINELDIPVVLKFVLKSYYPHP